MDIDLDIPLTELSVEIPKVGEFGEITLKVEVMGVDKECIKVIKHGPVVISKPFKEMDLEEMKKRIGTVEDTEMPMKKEMEDEEDDEEADD